jgi:hypothetical protein
MERSEAFKNVVTTIKILEEKLALCTNISNQSLHIAEQEIEDHFAKCLNALAARKEELLREVKLQVNIQGVFICLL